MPNNQKKLLLVSPLLFVFVFYIASTIIKNELWSDILSTAIAFLSSLFIFLSILEKRSHRIQSIFLLLCCFIWGIADFLWFISANFLGTNPLSIPQINALYVLPNILFAILLTHYIFKSHVNWNIYQLVIDIFAFCALGMLLLWSTIFSNMEFRFLLNFDHTLIVFYIFLDFFVLIEILIICNSKGFKIGTGFFIILVGIFIFALSDFYYAYLSLENEYTANTLVDITYMLCLVLFALGTFYEMICPSVLKMQSQKELSENLRKPDKAIFIMIIFFSFLYIFNYLSFNPYIQIIMICVIYWVLSTNIRANVLDRLMLKTEKEINEYLEKQIAERTKELNLVNQNLEEISNRDVLTGLYNRRYLIHHLENLVSANGVENFALLYIDANRFKPINDSYGHSIGDKVLAALGNRFSEFCSPKCTPFRIGGDEFAVIIENYVDKFEISDIADKIFEKLQLPISVSPYTFTLTASIGITLYPEDALDKDVLIRYADIAMYEVKSSHHKNNYLFFDKNFIEKINKKHEIEFLLQNADYNKEFMLFYQPQYNIENQRLVGMEALIRWQHPEKGFISPSEFIPIAEETGMIIHIGEWVAENAFSQIKKWNESYSMNLKMSINISPIQIKNIGFIEWLQEKMQAENIHAEWIDLEITESVAMISTSSIEKIFDFLNEMGISISIDDFGTGYSSLSYIRKYNIDRLKIAKELIDTIAYDENALLIVQAIIMMASGLNLKTISEGVEETEQLAILKKLGCNEVQGYIFGKPVPCDEFEKLHLIK